MNALKTIVVFIALALTMMSCYAAGMMASYDTDNPSAWGFTLFIAFFLMGIGWAILIILLWWRRDEK